MDQVVHFLKRNRRHIFRLARKLFRAFKKNGAGLSAGMGAGMGAGMAQNYQGAYGYPPGPQVPQGYTHGFNQGPGGPVPYTEQILGTSDIHAFDDNNVNAQNPQYRAWRNQARSEGDKMANAYDASHKAYQHGDHIHAHALSEEGNMHKMRMEQLNQQAVQWIFAANNADSTPGTVDLHGLYTKEALAKVEEVIHQARAMHWNQLRLIVGKGIHSHDHVAHIKPAVQQILQQYQISAHIDKHNTGVVVVDMNAPPGSRSRSTSRGAAGNSECIVM